MEEQRITSHSVERTIQAGAAFGDVLGAGQVVALLGDLGAGKTHFVKGIAQALGIHPDTVSSPTFSIAQEYRGGRFPLYHIDCYRLSNVAEFERTGAQDYIGGDGICLIEWPQRIESLLPMDTILVSIRHRGDGGRDIRILPSPAHA